MSECPPSCASGAGDDRETRAWRADCCRTAARRGLAATTSNGCHGAGSAWRRRQAKSTATAPYKRIATEEAWTFPALVKAQVEYLESGEAPDDDRLRMGGMFAKMPSLQEMLQDLGELRLAHMDEYGIDRQLLLLTAPGVQVVRPGDGTALAREANDLAADACRRHPDRFSACAAFDPRDVAGSVREIERGDDAARAQRRGAQLALPGALPRRARVLRRSSRRSRRTTRRSTSTRPRRSTRRTTRSRVLRRARRLSARCVAAHDGADLLGRVRPLSRSCGW